MHVPCSNAAWTEVHVEIGERTHTWKLAIIVVHVTCHAAARIYAVDGLRVQGYVDSVYRFRFCLMSCVSLHQCPR